MDVRDVDDQSVADAQRGRRRLREEQRRLEVGPHQIVPVDLGDIAHRCRVERRRIVDEDIERTEVARRDLGQRLQLTDIEQIRLDDARRSRAVSRSTPWRCLRGFRGAPVVQNDIRARSMQFARDSRAHPARGTRDQRSLAGQRAVSCGLVDIECDYDRICSRTQCFRRLSADEERAFRGRCGLDSRAHRGGRRVAVLRGFHGAGAVCARIGLLQCGSVKLGAGGDFVTAPEVSDLFSRCVARQCADVLAATGGDILELGAGTGRMAACHPAVPGSDRRVAGTVRHPRSQCGSGGSAARSY